MTDTIKITKDMAKKLLREVVAGREDYVYEPPQSDGIKCVYQYCGKPSCLIGHALFLARVPVSTLKLLDAQGSIKDECTLGVLENAGVHVTPRAVEVFKLAQGLQDDGYTWGATLAAAVAV